MKRAAGSHLFLQLSLALMLIATGVLGIDSYNSGGAEFLRGVNKAFGGSNDVIPSCLQVIELVAGAILVISLFNLIPSQLLNILLLIIFIFWAVNIALSYIINGFLEPSFIKWLASLSPQLIILSSLWIVYRGN